MSRAPSPTLWSLPARILIQRDHSRLEFPFVTDATETAPRGLVVTITGTLDRTSLPAMTETAVRMRYLAPPC
jgi:hypothetical protein